MQILRVIGGLFALLLCTAFAIAFLPNVANMANSARTDPAEALGLSCTSNPNGGCEITLPSKHMHPDTSGMTVTVTNGPIADTNVTPDTTVGANRLTLTIANGTLSNNTGYQFTVDYSAEAENIADATGLGDMLNLFPLFFVLMLLVVGVMVGGLAVGRQLST